MSSISLNKESKSFLAIIAGLVLGLLFLELLLRGVGYYFTNWNKFTHIKTKQTNELRILTLGESMTNSGVNPYPQQLQDILSNNPKIEKEINVINGGVLGTSSRDIVKNLESNLDRYDPDIVVVMTGINNDSIVDYEQWANIKQEDKINNINTIKLIKYLYQNLKNKLSILIDNINISYAYAVETNVDNIINYISKKVSEYENQYDNSETVTELTLKEKLNNTANNKDDVYMELCDYYASVNNKEKLIISALKAISINPNNFRAYKKLSDDVTVILSFEEKEALMLKSLELGSDYIVSYIHLGLLYSNSGTLSLLKNNTYKEKELEVYKKGLEKHPDSTELWFWLGKYYYWHDNLEEAEKAFNKALSLNNHDLANRTADIYQLLAKIYQKQGRVEDANKVLSMAIESSDVLENNYPIIADILKRRGVKLIAMQYPLRDVDIIKKILKDYEVTYVDNKKSFEDAIKRDGVEKIFIDLFAGDFGHCTPEGNRIMANNVASVILENHIHE